MFKIEEIKTKLLKEKEELKMLIENFDKEMTFIKENPEYEYSDVSELFEEKQDIHIKREFLNSRLAAIERALLRIENNTFGLCLKCGKPIEEQRIQLDPTLEYCREHSY